MRRWFGAAAWRLRLLQWLDGKDKRRFDSLVAKQHAPEAA